MAAKASSDVRPYRAGTRCEESRTNGCRRVTASSTAVHDRRSSIMNMPRRSSRRYLLVIAVAATILATGFGVAAVAQQPEADVYTACLNEQTGNIRRVAIGPEPARQCTRMQTEISWDRAGPASDARIAALEERIAQETVAAPSAVRLFAAATVDVTTVENSVGPLESVTSVGPAHYRVALAKMRSVTSRREQRRSSAWHRTVRPPTLHPASMRWLIPGLSTSSALTC